VAAWKRAAWAAWAAWRADIALKSSENPVGAGRMVAAYTHAARFEARAASLMEPPCSHDAAERGCMSGAA
jgi:hypothetical protein